MPATVQMQLGESWLRTGSMGARSSELSGGFAGTPDAASLDIVGDLDVRIDLTAVDWTPPLSMILAAKWYNTGNQRSWTLILLTDGTIEIVSSTDGTFSSPVFFGPSTAAVAAADGERRAVRVTLDVDNGASGKTATFYTADTIDGPWTQLGSAVTTAGTTSLYASSADLTLATCHEGRVIFSDAAPFNGQIHAFELYDGIGGTRVAALDLTGLPPRAETITDNEGLVWSVSGTSVVQRGWVDVPVYERTAIDIVRGRPNEAGSVTPSKASFELNNRGGDYSPRNPTGAYFGLIGRNTPVRIWQTGNSVALRLTRPHDDFTFCADSAALSLAGDLDLRIELSLPDWAAATVLIRKAAIVDGDGQAAYTWQMRSDGTMRLFVSADGSSESFLTSIPIPPPSHGRRAVRVTLDVDNGASGKTATFYTADTIDGPWTQLGDPDTSSGTISIHDSSAELRIGGPTPTRSAPGSAHARIYAAEVRDGIGGTVVASPDWTGATDGDEQLVDGQGNVWFLAGEAEVTSRDDRFHGEAGSLPTTWDRSGADVAVPIQAAGILRRLGQGASPLQSTLRRGMTTTADVVAYWPCEDGEDSTSIASALPDGLPMGVTGAPDWAASSAFKCSNPIPTLKGSTWSGIVPDYEDAGAIQLWFLLAIPQAGVDAERTLVRIWTPGATALIWQLNVDDLGNMRLYAFSSTLSTLVDSGLVFFDTNGKLLRVEVSLQQNGANIDWSWSTLEVGLTSGGVNSGTLSSATLGTCQRVDVAHEQVLDDVVVGHVSVRSEIANFYDLASQLNAFLGETAGVRIGRLCDEEGIDRVVLGGSNDTAELGYQLPKTLVDLVKEAADADGGILHEPRDALGIAYRTRTSLCAQEPLAVPGLTLDYSGNQISELQPVDDDTYTRNDVEVTRIGGASARRALEAGRLSVQPPPAGVGRYDDSVQLSLEADAQTTGQASWRTHLGTIDEPRYPSIAVELSRQTFVDDAALTAAVRALDIGDLVAVENPPAWMPPETIRQIVQGAKERITAIRHTVSWSGAPASAWDTGVYDDTGSRYSSQGSYLAAAAGSSDTTISVRTPTGSLWGDDDAPYDLLVGGERMTVTAVSGSTSPQTLTVTRAVNGVAKSHREGVEVALFRPVYYAL